MGLHIKSESDFSCAQDPGIPVWFIWEVPDAVDIAHFQCRPMANRSLFAKFKVRSSLRLDAIVITTDGRTDRHSANVLEFCANQMSPKNLRSQINISMLLIRIDKSSMPSMRRV